MSDAEKGEKFNFTITEGTKFILFCLTCHALLMETSKHPTGDDTLNRVARNASLGHQKSFQEPHEVVIFDLSSGNGSLFPPSIGSA